ncbi:hypothetical protein SAMD00079811_11860 [Scytonema sp. HK-05]|nr:hypothetical protein SAMD00079811_11860 [Scytonema sp. HK-05]
MYGIQIVEKCKLCSRVKRRTIAHEGYETLPAFEASTLVRDCYWCAALVTSLPYGKNWSEDAHQFPRHSSHHQIKDYGAGLLSELVEVPVVYRKFVFKLHKPIAGMTPKTTAVNPC